MCCRDPYPLGHAFLRMGVAMMNKKTSIKLSGIMRKALEDAGKLLDQARVPRLDRWLTYWNGEKTITIHLIKGRISK